MDMVMEGEVVTSEVECSQDSELQAMLDHRWEECSPVFSWDFLSLVEVEDTDMMIITSMRPYLGLFY